MKKLDVVGNMVYIGLAGMVVGLVVILVMTILKSLIFGA